jgi:hypothetical protein
MTEQETVSLANQTAKILVSKDEEHEITFGPDVLLEWASGSTLNPTRKPDLHPEIKGSVRDDKNADYKHIQDAELILNDKRVFKISFLTPTYFTAHQSINSRNVVPD